MVDELLDQRFGALTAAQLAALDGAAIELGVDIVQLMEIAGLQVARRAWELLDGRRGRVLVLAGRGNNGGDGLVAARMLDAWGCSVSILLAGHRAHLGETLTAQLRALAASDAELADEVTADEVAQAAAAADLAVDALLGTGLRDAPRPADAALIEALRAPLLLAVDVPSGLDATSGATPGSCVRATDTCTLTAMKAGLWTPSGAARAGRIVVADIGMPARAWAKAGLRRPLGVIGGVLLPVPTPTG